jgi:hypothetical protein
VYALSYTGTRVRTGVCTWVLAFLARVHSYLRTTVRSRTYVLVVATLTLDIYTLWSIAVQPWRLFGSSETFLAFTFEAIVCSHLKQSKATPSCFLMIEFLSSLSRVRHQMWTAVFFYLRKISVFCPITLFTFNNAYIILPPPSTSIQMWTPFSFSKNILSL